MNRLVLVCLAALAATAASRASPGPIVTRGSAAVPPGCDPASVAAIATARAAGEGRTLVYAAVLPSRTLDPHEAAVKAGVTGPDGSFTVSAVVDCTAASVVSWTEEPTPFFTTPGLCPAPPNWRSGDPVVACAGLPTAWETSSNFTVKSTLQSTGPCGATSARARVVALFRALDYGRAQAFASSFAPDGLFRPYSASFQTPFAGRTAIGRFAARRIAAADGWTATWLLGPLDRTRAQAEYRVSLTAYVNGAPAGAGNARLVLDCHTGLIRSWAGPALPLPR